MDLDESNGTLECRLVRVSGRVQGVGYRDACVDRARALGLTGWVRNRMDGSVEAMLQGPSGALDRMCGWMRDDMPYALVEDMQVTALPPPFTRLPRFDRRPTE